MIMMRIDDDDEGNEGEEGRNAGRIVMIISIRKRREDPR